MPRRLGRAVVAVLEKVDEGVDEVLYRPAVVKAFTWLPRWWKCDLARLSMAIDDRWRLGWWDESDVVIGDWCEACGRRASLHVYGGVDDDHPPVGTYLDDRPIYVCGWCRLEGDAPILDEDDVRRELAQARARSVAWRWR